MNNKILILGASVLQLPAIKTAKRMGLTVGVADYNDKAIGIEFADAFFSCSTTDAEGVLAAAQSFKPDGIMTMATDLPMRTVAYVGAKLHLPTLSEQCAFNCTDKIEMIRCFKRHDVPSPEYSVITSREEVQNKVNTIAFPAIMKPADNSGSRGVALVNDTQDCLDNYEYVAGASHSGSILVEEFMRGPEVSVEVFVVDGKAHVLQITDKVTTGAPHFVELGHSQPSKLDASVKIRIGQVAQLACESVGLLNGPAHLEMIVTNEGPKMVEMGARMGGDCITSHLVPLSTGIDMTEQTIRCALGQKPDLKPKFAKASAVLFITAPKGIIAGISGMDKAAAVDGVADIGLFKHVGDRNTDIHSSSDRIGYVVAQADNTEEAISVCRKARAHIDIDVR